MRKFVSYLRVSTQKQGRSGLGLEAQRTAVENYLNGGQWKLVKEYVEVESGKSDHRPELQKALHHAKVTGATLVIAKLDRLSRNVGFIDSLQQSKVKFVCADMPEANDTMIGFMAVMARHERKAVSERTKAALQAIKSIEKNPAAAKARRARGKKPLGNPNGARALRRAGKGNTAAVEALKGAADAHARDIMPIVIDIEASGTVTLQGITTELNGRGILTARRGRWHPTTVKKLLARVR
jgi:DNA invertase Pin-like site-specific DNA recombinase